MKKKTALTMSLFGAALLAVGFWLLKSSAAAAWSALPYLFVGTGCGVFGHGAGELLGSRALKNAPEIRKQLEIEKKDERNFEIACRAKSKAYDAMVYIFGALIFSLSLMKLQTVVILLFVFAYLLVVGIAVYYRIKYDKEM